MVDISSQNNKINVTVSSSGNTANTNVTPDYAQYYSEKSKEWAISNRIVDNTDYSSKYYANESKKQADISTAKATEVVESGNTAVSNIENARDIAILDVNTAGATQIGLIQNEGATQIANVQSTGFYMRDDKLYFINSQGEETEFKLDDIELNNPYSLFDSKYSDHELNNLSWLKSEGQWNSKAVYPDAYDKILENVNNCAKGFLGQTMYMWGSASGGYMTTSLTPVVGSAVYEYTQKRFVGYVTGIDLTIPAISFRDDVAGISYTNITRYSPSDEGSSAYITDYDFVLNTADETFRLPLLDGSEEIADTTYSINTNTSNISITTTVQNIFRAPKNGICYFILQQTSANSTTFWVNNKIVASVGFNSEIFTKKTITIPVKRGDNISAQVDQYNSLLVPSYFNANIGNGSLYYYVGETVQNANLIDAGRIGEQLATKTDMLQASGAGMPSGKVINLTLGASDTSYTAPANGWVYIRRGTTASGQMVTLTAQVASRVYSTASGQQLQTFIPVHKGDTFVVTYTAPTAGVFRFTYAEGEI